MLNEWHAFWRKEIWDIHFIFLLTFDIRPTAGGRIANKMRRNLQSSLRVNWVICQDTPPSSPCRYIQPLSRTTPANCQLPSTISHFPLPRSITISYFFFVGFRLAATFSSNMHKFTSFVVPKPSLSYPSRSLLCQSVDHVRISYPYVYAIAPFPLFTPLFWKIYIFMKFSFFGFHAFLQIYTFVGIFYWLSSLVSIWPGVGGAIQLLVESTSVGV